MHFLNVSYLDDPDPGLPVVADPVPAPHVVDPAHDPENGADRPVTEGKTDKFQN